MNHLEYSQSVRRIIESDSAMYKVLRQHFLLEKRIESKLGEFLSGTDNIFEIGRVGDIYIASREDKGFSYFGGRMPFHRKKQHLPRLEGECQGFGIQADKHGVYGFEKVLEKCLADDTSERIVPSFCIGVKFKPEGYSDFMYALLVEDLSQGRRIQFENYEQDGDVATIAGTNVSVRFDAVAKYVSKPESYMTDEMMLVFEPTHSSN